MPARSSRSVQSMVTLFRTIPTSFAGNGAQGLVAEDPDGTVAGLQLVVEGEFIFRQPERLVRAQILRVGSLLQRCRSVRPAFFNEAPTKASSGFPEWSSRVLRAPALLFAQRTCLYIMYGN